MSVQPTSDSLTFLQLSASAAHAGPAITSAASPAAKVRILIFPMSVSSSLLVVYSCSPSAYRTDAAFSFAAWKPLIFFQHVQIHVIAHVALGSSLQRLIVPWVIGSMAQRRIDDLPACLAFAHRRVENVEIPARPNLGGQFIQNASMCGIAGEIDQFVRVGCEIDQQRWILVA